MHSIVYLSQAVGPVDSASLTALVEAARERNASLTVSGALLYAYGGYLQELEGPPESLRTLMASISADPRHTAVTVLDDSEVDSRAYGSWSMGLIELDLPALAALTSQGLEFESSTGAPPRLADLVRDATAARALLRRGPGPGSAPVRFLQL